MSNTRGHYSLNGMPCTKEDAARVLANVYCTTQKVAISTFTRRAKCYLGANRVAAGYTDSRSGVSYSRFGR